MQKSGAVLKPGRKFGSLVRALRKAAADDRLPEDTRQISEMLLSRADRILENFKTIIDAPDLGRCRAGLAVTIHVDSDETRIAFSLDNLNKEAVTKRIKKGELFEEVMTLYRLALLPGTESFTMNIALPGLNIDIIDRVYLYMVKSFHPYRKKKSVAPLDVLASHIPYDKAPKIERGIRWLQEMKSTGIAE